MAMGAEKEGSRKKATVEGGDRKQEVDRKSSKASTYDQSHGGGLIGKSQKGRKEL